MEDDEEERLHQKKLNELLNSLNQKDKVVELNKDNFQEFIKTHEISVIDFWAPWCAPCHILSPLVEDLSKKYPGISVAKVNGDENMELLYRYSVTGLPTVLFFKNGSLVERSVGVVPFNVLEGKLKWLMQNH
ncbi:co-chaperone YbbN [Acidiplasma sp.]|jgi:thioredoxin 1|uniref:thioredoxin family protein n=1 Tax=Acidiplasma TaxID=507753 RepID=UPI0025905CED|nr:thioredoxin family protein [Acidiplasma sp.]